MYFSAQKKRGYSEPILMTVYSSIVGLTETCAGSFVARPHEMGMVGTVGPPLPVVDIRLESVPDMGYDAISPTNPCGEICIRGKCLFSGYYKREDLTREVMDEDWFHTGDIGEWQPDGSMKIIDRKKNIFKLSQGEYVSVEHLESIYSLASCVDAVSDYILALTQQYSDSSFVKLIHLSSFTSYSDMGLRQ